MKNALLSTVIIDDEPDSIEVLAQMISESYPDLKVTGTACTVKDGINMVQNVHPEIVFLDIQMPGGSGFDILKNTDSNNFHTIFISAHENYAIEAIKFHALAYLLKPIGINELDEAIDRVLQKVNETASIDYTVLLDSFQEQPIKRIAIPTGVGYRYFQKHDIIRIEAAKNYSNVYTADSAKPILVSRNLKQFENLLSKHGFLRIHHAHLVNPNHIIEYTRQEGGSLLMSTGSRFYIGQRYRKTVITHLNNNSDCI